MHVLAQVGKAVTRPSPVLVTSAAIVASATAATTLGLQFGYGDDFTKYQLSLDMTQHAGAGAGLAAGGLAVGALKPKRPLPALAGVAIGAAAGAYLVTPIVRRVLAD